MPLSFSLFLTLDNKAIYIYTDYNIIYSIIVYMK